MAMNVSWEVRGATSVGGSAANVIVVAMGMLWVGSEYGGGSGWVCEKCLVYGMADYVVY